MENNVARGAINFLSFPLCCWKERNHHIHREQPDRNTISRLHRQQGNRYPPHNMLRLCHWIHTLDPSFKSRFRNGHAFLSTLLAVPHWALSQSYYKHNLKLLLKRHLPINHHIHHMTQNARRQGTQPNQLPSNDTPHKARTRAVQLAVKEMNAKLYALKPRHSTRNNTTTHRCRSWTSTPSTKYNYNYISFHQLS